MTFVNLVGRGILAGAVSAFALPAGAVVFDFGSGVVGGPVGVTGITSPAGIAFDLSASGVGNQGTGEVSLFDPSIPSNLDADPDMIPLGRDNDPNVFPAKNLIGVEDTGTLIGWDFGSPNSLILQEDNNAPGIPDDSGGGGTMTFTLPAGADPVRLVRLSFVDDVDAVVSVSGIGEVGEIDIGATTPHCGDAQINGDANGDNCVAGLDFTGGSVIITSSFSVEFNGSGGVLGFEVEEVRPVPLPAGLTLMLTGLAGFGWLRRTKA